ncbi:hypothetical protein B0A55_07787 [Friedmanniomyces simplex]|uniref:Aminoglycoside phosphotransferase domain-containing protein n=1 Tax=Friedmanniomyces simplex TaxID=329884 RepID=A0A4U0WWL2_9PEZI|nr:hypothetical protein B0A55_07787 [Friedmanniomyces simplex]
MDRMQSFFNALRRWLEDLLFPIRMRLGRKIMWIPERKIVQISQTTLIKGPVSQQEIEAMRFVAANAAPSASILGSKAATVCLPAIRRTYQRSDGLYVAMDFVEGDRLDLLWPKLNGDMQEALMEQIWAQVTTIRALTTPKRLHDIAVGSAITGRGVHDGILSLEPVGPFASLADFCDFLRLCPNIEYFQHLLDGGEDDGDEPVSVFSHADICGRNIIIRRSDGMPCLIDWELAGWWPPRWEYVKARFTDFPVLPGWIEMFEGVSGMKELYGK